MRYFKQVVLVCLLIVSSTFFIVPSALAATSEDDFTFNSATGTITDYIGSGGDVDIPSQIGGVNVVEIGDSAFYNCDTITSVIIPGGVTSIGSEAFSSCDIITSVIIPEGVTSIGSQAFRDCGDLTSIDLPDSLTDIGYDAFSYSGLLEVYMPEGITTLNASFQNCYDLVKFVFSSTIDTIQTGTLANTTISIIYIPDTVTTIGTNFLYNCNNLYAVVCEEGSVADSTISSRKLYLDENDFIFDSSTGTITGYTGSKTNVFIPSEIGGITVSSISSNAFEGTTSFEYVGIADTITNIGDEAFKDCPNLISVFVSESVTSIGTNAFIGCDDLEEIRVHIWNSEYKSVDGILFKADETTLIKYPPNHANASYTIPSSVNEVAGYAFYGCNNLTNITIPNNVTSLGQYSFYGCEELLEVDLPSGLSEVPNYAFADCVKLGSVGGYTLEIPDSVTRIGEAAFKSTDASSYSIPLGLERIEAEAFMDCDRFSTMRFGVDTVFFGDKAFYGCDGVKGVIISSKSVSLGSNTFDNCAVLSANYGLVGYRGYDVETYASANSLTFTPIFYGFDTATGEIDQYLGRDEHLVVPTSINVSGTYYDVKILDSGFCISKDELISIEIEEGLTTIEQESIRDCFNLERIDLPNSITSIEERALSYCIDLERITIPTGITGGIHADAIHSSNNVKIYGYSGTYAEQYASDNSIPFVSLGYVTGISVLNQPNKMSYLSGESLDLSGLTVKLTYSDATTVDVDYADFSVYSITTSPVHGDALDITHNNTPITITCNGESAVTNNLTVLINGDAETPNITVQPDDVSCNVGDTETVSVTASVSDGGTLSYQWYSNAIDSNSGGSLISGATLSSYTVPTTSVGITYYYCIITNTNSYVTGNTTATTTSDTATVTVSEVSVTGIEFTNSHQLINISITDALTNICPYTITPSDATDTDVIWQSSNPSVASISGTMITANMVGRTTITVTTNDGGYTDTMIVEVKDTDSAGSGAQYGYIKGTLVDGSGNPLPNYTITLYSDPISTTTYTNGGFKISSMPFMNHTLVVSNPSGIEVGRFALNMSSSGSSGVSIDNTNNIANITYTSNSIGIELAISTNATYDDINISRGNVIHRLALAANPQTSDDNSYWQIILLIVLATCILLGFYLKKKLLIKK